MLEKAVLAIGGKRSIAAVKKLGRGFLDKRSKRLKRSSASDIERLKKLQPAFLHFGCGPRIMKGWANIDISFMKDWEAIFARVFSEENDKGTTDDFFRIDFTEAGIPLPDDSVTGIFHEDFIEHISQRDAFVFLAETLRVLKSGSIHRISTPDLSSSMKRHSDFSKGKAGVYVNEWNKHGHINVFTPAYLEEIARLVGYSQVIFTAKNESRLKPSPKAYRPGNDRLDSEQIFCDLIK